MTDKHNMADNDNNTESHRNERGDDGKDGIEHQSIEGPRQTREEPR